MMKTSLFRTSVRLIVCVVLSMAVLFPTLVNTVSAISEQQRRFIRSGIYYYDSEDEEIAQCYGPVQLVGSDNIEMGYNFFIDKGLQPIHSAGLIGNFMLESGMNPEAFNPAGGGQGAYGIAQWRAKRQAALREKPNYESLGTQLEFVWEELQGGERQAYDQLLQTSTVEEAAVIVDRYYERSEQAHHAERISYAKSVLAEHGSGAGVSGGSYSGTGCPGELPDGEAPELAQALLDSSNVNSDYENQLENIAAGLGPCPTINSGNYTVDAELLRVLVALAETNTYTISSLHRGCTSDSVGAGQRSRHWRGKAVDISGSRPINGDTMEGSFNSHSAEIQRFVNEALVLLQPNCELGVPNSTYINGTDEVEADCTNIFLDTPETTGATGPHIHIGVP